MASPDSTDALTAAVGNPDVTCIKLAPIVYAPASTLTIGGAEDVHAQVTTTTSLRMSGDGARKLAIVAEEGQATLDGGGSITLLRSIGADVALANLAFRNGGPSTNGVRLAYSEPACTAFARL